MLLASTPELLECFFGLALIGAIVVPLNWRLAPPEIAHNAKDSGIRALVYGTEFRESAAALRDDLPADCVLAVGDGAECDRAYEDWLQDQPVTGPEPVGAGDDPLVIIYTSGTTCRPNESPEKAPSVS